MAKGRQSRNQREQAPPRSGRTYFGMSVLAVLGLAVVLPILFPIFNLRTVIRANYFKMAPIPALEGNLKPNDKLTKASYIAHKKVFGPETIVFSANGSMYTGLMNGQIVRVDSEGNVHKVVQIGPQTDEKICNDFSQGLHEECGRPLGLRIRPGTNILYVADSYLGIFKVDLTTGTKQLVLDSKDPRFGTAPPRLVNDLDFDGDNIYFIDSSRVYSYNQAFQDIFEMGANGRLFKYDEKSDLLEQIAEDLYYPNGLQLLPNKEAILVNECSVARVIKVHLGGPKRGQRETWAELPGLGDTLRLTASQTLLVPVALMRHPVHGSIADRLGEYPIIRSILGTIFNLNFIYSFIPNYGLLAEYDLDGKPLRSWHDPTGQVLGSNTNAAVYNNKLYIGSYISDRISVIDYN